MEGVLVEIEPEPVEKQERLEVCLADEKGEELDLTVWQRDIKEGKEARTFSILTGTHPDKKDRAVQTDWSAGQEGFAT